MFTCKNILVAPLDWGLGHATRCVPIIKELLKNNTVILGVTPLTKTILELEFPQLKKIELPAYEIEYSRTLPLWIKLGLSYPRLSGIIEKEKKLLDKLIADYKIEIVISDNRFGLYSSKAHCVFITHQVFLKAPAFQNLAQSVNKKYILKYNEVWVPDHASNETNLSGELSHGNHFHKNVKYIGPKSRLQDVICDVEKNKYDYLILLSGPEQGRTTLEEALLKKAEAANKRISVVRGTQLEVKRQLAVGSEVLDVFDFPSKEVLKKLILSSQTIICRSGYSTLMDMHVLGKNELILIPTPGQTEQEYLADYWHKQFGTTTLLEKNIQQFNL